MFFSNNISFFKFEILLAGLGLGRTPGGDPRRPPPRRRAGPHAQRTAWTGGDGSHGEMGDGMMGCARRLGGWVGVPPRSWRNFSMKKTL